MKKYILMSFVAALTFSFISCKEDDGTTPGNDDKPVATLYTYTVESPYNPDNDVAVLENDPMYHPGTIDDGDFYDPDVNAVDYMAEGEGIPDELMDNDGVAGWADGIVEGIKDLGESIANVFSGDAKDDFMNGDSNGIDEDGSPDYINDANVDAFQ